MEPQAIVFTSNTGFTRKYAILLGEKTALPVYALEIAPSHLPVGSEVIYLGWIHASHVKGFSRAAKQFTVCAVCGVGLCDTGTLVAEVRGATYIPAHLPVFTLQGGLDRSQLKGINKLMISMLQKGLASQTQRTDQDERMLQLLSQDADYVREENLKDVLDWYRTLKSDSEGK